jgi:hypothetical protein
MPTAERATQGVTGKQRRAHMGEGWNQLRCRFFRWSVRRSAARSCPASPKMQASWPARIWRHGEMEERTTGGTKCHADARIDQHTSAARRPAEKGRRRGRRER